MGSPHLCSRPPGRCAGHLLPISAVPLAVSAGQARQRQKAHPSLCAPLRRTRPQRRPHSQAADHLERPGWRAQLSARLRVHGRLGQGVSDHPGQRRRGAREPRAARGSLRARPARQPDEEAAVVAPISPVTTARARTSTGKRARRRPSATVTITAAESFARGITAIRIRTSPIHPTTTTPRTRRTLTACRRRPRNRQRRLLVHHQRPHHPRPPKLFQCVLVNQQRLRRNFPSMPI